MNFQLENNKLYCWQWDIRQRLLIDGLETVEAQVPTFLIGNNKSKEGLYKVKIKKEGDIAFINIPDEVLQKEGHADVYLYDETSGTTILAWRFTIKKKAKPMDYVYEETDILTLVELADRLEYLEENALSNLPIASEQVAGVVRVKKASSDMDEFVGIDKDGFLVSNTLKMAKSYADEAIRKAELDDVVIDAGLDKSGYAADAKAVGEALAQKQPVGNYALKSELVQANWNQNDSEAPDYIKNRLAWTEYAIGETIFEYKMDIGAVEESVRDRLIGLQAGEKYVVTYSDVEYVVTANVLGYGGIQAVYIGNFHVLGGIDTGEPFLIIDILADNRIDISAGSDAYIKIAKYIETVHQIDPKYYERLGWVDYAKTEIIPETTITIIDAQYVQEGIIGLQDGHSYVVNWNGMEYELQCSLFFTEEVVIPYIGNLSILGIGSDTGESFIVFESAEENASAIHTTSGDGYYTVSISEFKEDVHKIDKKFLPESDKVTWDYIGLEKKEIFNGTLSGFANQGMITVNSLQFELVDGQEYEVIWDGVSYNVTPYTMIDKLALGNTMLLGTNSGEPFIFHRIDEDVPTYDVYSINVLDGTLNSIINKHTAIIRINVLNPIPEQYLPNNIAIEKIAGLQNELYKKIELVNNIEYKYFTMPTTARWSSIAYGSNKFVAIAYNSNMAAYSEDGVNWTATTMPNTRRWRSVTYGNNKFVAIENSFDMAAYSEDGINWTATTMPMDASWHSITYGNNKFVAISNNICIAAYSEDGINWTATTMPSNWKFYSVAYGNGKFVAVGSIADSAPYVFYSEDCVVWTPVRIGNDRLAIDLIAYGNDKFIIASSNANMIAYSDDGVNWVEATSPYEYFHCRSITCGNNKLIVVSNSTTYKKYYSEDYINWTEITMPDNPDNFDYNLIGYGDGKFIAITDNSDKVAYVAHSEDGINWTNKIPVREYSTITQNNTDITEDIKDILDISYIPKIETAKVGQVIVVKAIDENGKPTEWEAVDVDEGFSGDYNDLTNKPTIPSIVGLATETYVNNAVAQKSQIQIITWEDDD